MKTFLVLFILISFPSNSFSSELAEEKLVQRWDMFWSKEVNRSISKILENKNPWFSCYGSYLSEKQDAQQLEEKKLDLFMKMRELVASSFVNSEAQSANAIKSRFMLEAKLNKAGGYKNKVLSLSVARLAGSEILSMALEDTNQAGKLAELLTERNEGTAFNTRKTLIAFASEDPNLAGHTDEFEKALKMNEIKDAHNLGFWAFYEKLIQVLPEEIEPKDFQELDQIYTDPSVYKLENHQVGVELFMRSTLPGLLAYLEKGGEIKKLDPGSVTAFNQTMGDDRWNYSFPYTGVQKPSPAFLLRAIDEVKSEDAKRELLSRLAFDDL